MNITGVLEHYFEWLCDKVGYDERYDDVLKKLLTIQYEWTHSMDENRAKDGLWMRRQFMDEEGVRGDPFEGMECGVLEMMVALAVRLEDSVLGDPNANIFWHMIESLGINEYSTEKEVVSAIYGCMHRTNIKPNGAGGFFSLQRPREDQRDLEIWAQAMAYLDELLGYQ